MPKNADRAIADYLAALRKNLADGGATEHTHRPALKNLLETVGSNITATNDPKRIKCGAPDFNITRRKIPVGHVETKDIGANLNEMERGRGPNGEQFTRYRDGLPNWILTDYLDFRWYVGGEKRLAARIGNFDGRENIKSLPSGEEELKQLLNAVFKQSALTIGTAKDLAERLAGMTRIIRDLIRSSFQQEVETGWLHNWLTAFREVLIPDLRPFLTDEERNNENRPPAFDDMFAQTLAYGLFAARVHTPSNKDFSREMAAFNLPKTNPFLRKLFSEIAGVDMPETIAWAVDDIVELLKHADMREILKDFGKGKGKEDPVVHFYETFLAAYDPKLREVRGVYYTPEPVVSYIVRSIEHLLKTRFNRQKGLADENTLILDPATGTATFLYFVVNQVYQKFVTQKGAWDSYVADHLLNRIFGFELLMAPYAIAHLKLAMQLQDLGYTFRSDQRLGIYLTNTLEEAAKRSEKLFANWISDEANAASAIKRDLPIMIVLGNPPYSGYSANKSEWISGLIDDYRTVDDKPLAERKVWLQDDYVKFIRFAQWRLERTGFGIIGFITNHGFLDNPTFRGMRQHLLKTFGEIYTLDLHGSVKRKEEIDAEEKDENVFDIQQGVAITLFVMHRDQQSPGRVYHAGLWGSREAKYKKLFEERVDTIKWSEVQPKTPYYFFVPRSEANQSEYENGWKVTDAFSINSIAIQTSRDHVAIDFDEVVLKKRVEAIRDTSISDDEAVRRYGLKEMSFWKIADVRKRLLEDKSWREHFRLCLYRPFDERAIYFSPIFVHRPREAIMKHLLFPNLALLSSRQLSVQGFRHIFCTNKLAEMCVISTQTKEQNYVFPLYLYDTEKRLFDAAGDSHARRPNFNPTFLRALADKLKLPQTQPGGLPKGTTPEDIFHYAYAVFHSPTYRTRYAEFLKIDFPRLPLTSDVKLFRALAVKGAELVALHLMESPKLNDFITTFPEKGSNEVEKIQYTDKDRRVWINKTQYFGGVPKPVWEFYIGGFQVCEKWLKERKGHKLSYGDIQHYQKIVVASAETRRIMNEVESLIPRWPIT